MTAWTDTDSLGAVLVPDGVYWGAHTARALENFAISGTTVGDHRALVAALGQVKLAAARANRDLGLLDPGIADVVERAAQEVVDGALDGQFVVDVVQGGAGTSTNMNANEVIANRALELLGFARGRYDVVHPLDHVNRSQSTNDVYPTAVKLALLTELTRLDAAVGRLSASFAAQAAAHRSVPKVGRTQLQDAVPMTVGQELRGWATTVAEEQPRLADVIGLLCEINLGATAIGTGINADPTYAEAVRGHLAAATGLPLVTAPDLVEATSDTGVFVQVSATVKRTAVKVSKICNDLRLLSSGPQAGLGELRLPPRQAGSSIMPGKVNPVIPEMVNQVAFWIVGTDVCVTMASEAGQLQLNAFEPIMCHGLLQGVSWLSRALDALREHCVDGIEVDAARLTAASAANVGVVTALTPYLGYRRAAEIGKAALAGTGTVRDLVLATGAIGPSRLDELLRPEALAGGVNGTDEPRTSSDHPDGGAAPRS